MTSTFYSGIMIDKDFFIQIMSKCLLSTIFTNIYHFKIGGSLTDLVAIPMSLCVVIVELYSTIMCEKVYKNLQEVRLTIKNYISYITNMLFNMPAN